ncbi:hypothetical protein [Limnoglobus roseus]|uniref:Uncharacterized protein n=1 Tax=Limnoglobus roseus TaxID=2598579 RepID=A0A5C1A4X8_9BACT|nr:hypothetical protein [Limnoglobus roseus]QEL13393.1 hypothetical protein PX52LOC_00247 [Limnoglobus roseus]
MDTPSVDADEHLRTTVTVQKFLIGGLALGAAVMGVVVTVMHFVVLDGKAMAPDLPRFGGVSILTLIVGVVVCSTTVASFIMADTVRRQTLARLGTAPPAATSLEDRRTLLAGWQGSGIVQAGLCEGPTILALVSFLITGDAVLLGVAGAMLALLLSRFPSEDSTRRWLDAAEEELGRTRTGA